MRSTRSFRGRPFFQDTNHPRQLACTLTALCIIALASLGLSQDPDVASSKDAWSDPNNPTRQFWDGERLDLWSLQPIKTHRLPDDADLQWSRNLIDLWIQDGLKNSPLRPSPAADPRTLARRVAIDLTGIPASFEEIEAFANNNDPMAYEQLVDRLLAEPDFGIRWGQHWLDVVRYADSNGFERDEWVANRWHYRQYVIDAFNQDLPYDEFLREQLAGDWMNTRSPDHPRSQERIKATLFLRLGPHDTYKEFFDSKELARDEYLTDVTNTVGTAILGQTMDCCRCHDHKTDPLLHADHYRLRAFFVSLDFDDEIIIDANERRQEIATQHAQLETQVRRLLPQREQLLAPGRNSQRTKVLSTFPSTIVALLQIPEAERETIDRSKLEPLLEALQSISDDECAEHLSAEDQTKLRELDAEIERLNAQKWTYTTLPGIRDSLRPATARVLIGGDIQSPMQSVFAGLPTLFCPDSISADPHLHDVMQPREILSQWITDRSNPWTSRVIANRLWHHYFGSGIAATVDDVGYSGTRPTHPQLLDALAIELQRGDWSLKRLHRQIVLSATYRQSSYCSPQAAEIDPFNHLFARQNPRRLDAESLRDALLSVSGLLRSGVVQNPLWPPIPEELLASQQGAVQTSSKLQMYHTSPGQTSDVRSVFLIRKRSLLNPFMTVFQLPDCNRACGRRDTSITPSQAMALLNNDLANRAANALAQEVLRIHSANLDHCASTAFHRVVGHPPTSTEHQLMMEFLLHPPPPSEPNDTDVSVSRRMTELCRALFNCNAFVFID